MSSFAKRRLLQPSDLYVSDLPLRHMTGDEVLTLLQDEWRLSNDVDPNVQYDIPIQRTTTIRQFARSMRIRGSLRYWETSAAFLKLRFLPDMTKEEWESILSPASERTLGAACDRIAETALTFDLPRVLDDGRHLAWDAAAFRAIALILRHHNVKTDGFLPDTPLNTIVGRAGRGVVMHIARLSPGRLPPLKETSAVKRVGLSGLMLALVLWMLGFLVPLSGWMLQAPLVLVFLSIVTLGISTLPNAHRFELGELKTLRDLCNVLTCPPPRWMGPPLLARDDEPGGAGTDAAVADRP